MPGVVAHSRRAFSLLHTSLYFLVGRQLASDCGVPALFDLSGNFIAMGGKPRLLLVQQAHSPLYELIDGLIGAALDVLPDLFFQLGAKMDVHGK
jgi:hypothetical protein